jgi:hypothetical protein
MAWPMISCLRPSGIVMPWNAWILLWYMFVSSLPAETNRTPRRLRSVPRSFRMFSDHLTGCCHAESARWFTWPKWGRHLSSRMGVVDCIPKYVWGSTAPELYLLLFAMFAQLLSVDNNSPSSRQVRSRFWDFSFLWSELKLTAQVNPALPGSLSDHFLLNLVFYCDREELGVRDPRTIPRRVIWPESDRMSECSPGTHGLEVKQQMKLSGIRKCLKRRVNEDCFSRTSDDRSMPNAVNHTIELSWAELFKWSVLAGRRILRSHSIRIWQICRQLHHCFNSSFLRIPSLDQCLILSDERKTKMIKINWLAIDWYVQCLWVSKSEWS